MYEIYETNLFNTNIFDMKKRLIRQLEKLKLN